MAVPDDSHATPACDPPAPCKRDLVVAVASTSKPKLEAARIGFERVLPDGCALRVQGVEAESGVSAQPVGDEETRQGARNRLEAVRATDMGRAADFCISFEGGVGPDAAGCQVCFAYVCVQHRDDDYVSETRSATHSLPPGIQALMKEGSELGIATDRFFADQLAAGYGKGPGGTIGALTRGVVDRVEFYSHPAALTLVPFMNAKAYGIKVNPLTRD